MTSPDKTTQPFSLLSLAAAAAGALAANALLLVPPALAAGCGGGGSGELLGLVDLADEPADITVLGADAVDFLGSPGSVAVGDLDGDGEPDLVVGSHRGDGPSDARRDAGEVVVLFGPHGTGSFIDLAATVARRLVVFGPRAGDWLGWSVVVGDVNGDGIDDLVAGAPQSDGPTGLHAAAGAVFVLHGPLGAGAIDLASAAADRRADGSVAGDRLGEALALGDLTGDGVADVAAAARGLDGPSGARVNAGGVVLLPGGGGGSSVVLHGPLPFESVGVALAVGDLTGDGAADLAVSSTGAGDPTLARPQAGVIDIVAGPFTPGVAHDLLATPPTARVVGRRSGDLLGTSLATGDLDGDGALDLVAGASRGSGPDGALSRRGEAHGLLGPFSGHLLVDLAAIDAHVVMLGAAAGDFLGWSVAAADLDGDGAAEMLAGAIGSDVVADGRFSAGRVHGVRGVRDAAGIVDLAASAAPVELVGPRRGAQLGGFLAVGDLSGDGAADLVTVARLGSGPDGGRGAAGEAHVVFGAPGTGGCAAAPVLVGVPEDAVVECGELPPPADVSVTHECDVEVEVELVEDVQPGGCPGTSVVVRTWTAVDECGGIAEAVQVIDVVDTTAPAVEAGSEDLAVLWPPNHQLVRFTSEDVQAVVEDACGGPVSWRFVDCASDQPADAEGDGSTEGDCLVEDGGQAFQVRAERSALSRTARRYAVSVVASDACGNEGEAVVVGFVAVGHDVRVEAADARVRDLALGAPPVSDTRRRRAR